MAKAEEKYMLPPENVEIQNNEFVLRSVIKKYHIDEENNAKIEAFLLRREIGRLKKQEKSLSVVVESLEKRSHDEIIIDIPLPFEMALCRLKAKEIRELLLGVCHSPNDTNLSHGSLCGFFDKKKALELCKISNIIHKTS